MSSKYAGCGVTINKYEHTGIMTHGEHAVVECWDQKARKYKVDFGNGFCGWYKRSELIFDKR